jgi:hypothetical protein
MKIVHGWNGARWLWVVQERRAEGRERETALTSEADAKVYRNPCKRRGERAIRTYLPRWPRRSTACVHVPS